MKCLICEKEIKNNFDLIWHVKTIHKISGKEYYDKYLKIDKQDGFCKTCGKETVFEGVGKNYRSFCSKKCRSNNDDVKKKREKYQKLQNKKEVYDKVKKTKLLKYGDINYVNYEKAKKTRLERYGDENYMRYGTITFENLMLDRYGVKNIFSNEKIKNKLRQLFEEKGYQRKLEDLEEFDYYRKMVRLETSKWKKDLYEKWDGCCYYSNLKLIKGDKLLSPTIDHKISIIYGFKNHIDAKIIGHINNLCICSKSMNSSKRHKIDEEFLKSLKMEYIGG